MWIVLFKILKDGDSCDGRPDASENGKFRAESYDFGIDRIYWNLDGNLNIKRFSSTENPLCPH